MPVLKLTKDILDLLMPLNKAFQSETMDVTTGIALIDVVRSTLASSVDDRTACGPKTARNQTTSLSAIQLVRHHVQHVSAKHGVKDNFAFLWERSVKKHIDLIYLRSPCLHFNIQLIGLLNNQDLVLEQLA
jgi:hypothetical protein